MILVEWVTPEEWMRPRGVAGVMATRQGVHLAVGGVLLGTLGDYLHVFSCLFLPGLVLYFSTEGKWVPLEC